MRASTGSILTSAMYRYNPRNNRKVLLRAISGQEQNAVCPVKMLLVSAMRLGAVKGTTEQILAGVASRRDKTLQWVKGRGSSPVLCAFETAAQHVNIDKAAMTDQLRFTMYKASLNAGFLKQTIPHDLRRGAAKDVAHLRQDPTAGTSLATASTAAELGQSARSLEPGITAAYVGSRNNDTWARRVEADFLDPFGLDVTDKVYKRPKWTQVDLVRMYKDAGIDPSDRKAMRALSDKKYKEHEQRWRSGEKNAESRRPGKFVEFASIAPGISNIPLALQPLSENRIRHVAIGKRKADPEQIQDLDTNDYIQNDAANSHNPTSIPDPDDIDSRIDPRLLDRADLVSKIVADIDGAAVMNDGLEEVVLNQLGAPLEIPSALIVPSVTFVSFFSRINVISNKRLASSKSKGIPDTFRGNGRDEPTLFQHKCRKTPGCKYYSDNRHHLLIHEARCSAERMEKIDSADRTHRVPRRTLWGVFRECIRLKIPP